MTPGVMGQQQQQQQDPPSRRRRAGVACLSVVHFSRAFKAAVGVSPHVYLTHRRVVYANRLLEESQFSIIQVGYACGFNSPAHFAATFRAKTGTSPSAYRTVVLN